MPVNHNPEYVHGKPNPYYIPPNPKAGTALDVSIDHVKGDFRFDPPPQAPPLELTEGVKQIVSSLSSAGARPLVVGGAVRDHLLGLDSKDIDIEVHNAGSSEWVINTLRESGMEVDEVGASFGVLLCRTRDGDCIDVSLPRRDSLPPDGGSGHKDIVSEVDPGMDVEEAARRRDLTINAIMFDPSTGEYIDPFGGMEDMHDKVIRVVDPDTFTEDHLRALRAVRFTSRFQGFHMDPETVKLCRNMSPDGLSGERIAGELRGILLRGRNVGAGIEALHEIGWSKVAPTLHPDREPLPENLIRQLQSSTGIPEEARLPLLATVVDARYGDGDGAFADTLMLSKSDRKMVSTLPLDRADTTIGSARMRRALHARGVDPDMLDEISVAADTVAAPPPWRGSIPPNYHISGDKLMKMGASPGPHFSEVISYFKECEDRGAHYTDDDVRRMLETSSVDPDKG